MSEVLGLPVISQNQDGTTSVEMSLTPSDQVGFDTQRFWATAAQVLLNPESGLIVFREMVAMQNETGENTILIKNVASVIMPKSAFIELHKTLGETLAKMQNAE